MTELVLFSIAESLIAKLASQAYEETSQVLGLYHHLQEFTQTLSLVKAVLLDAEEKQQQNYELQEWLRQVKHVFSDAENVLDEFECETLRKEVVQAHGSATTKVAHFFSTSNPLVFRYRLAQHIKKIKKRLDKVAADRHKFGLETTDIDRRVVHRRDMTYSYVVDSDVIGRNHDKENIIRLLVQQNPNNNDKSLSVISIVGIPGLGKTTLAKIVFNDRRIHELFQLKMWVCVSNDFNIKQVVIKILNSNKDSAHQQNLDMVDMEQLQSQLRNKLASKKFLLVLDDVWNEDLVKWVELRDLIQVDATGSKILVTTRDFVDYGIGFGFKIHDLVHDIARYLGRDSIMVRYPFVFRPEERYVQHLSFPENVEVENFPIHKFVSVRTILFPTSGVGANSEVFLLKCTSRCKRLRFLDLSDSMYEALPPYIGKLKHLRYLSLENNNNLKRLPDSLCNLLKLEVLILSGCSELLTLPNGLRKLISLQHLEITTKLRVLPEDEIANLSSLRILRIEFCNNVESLFEGIKLPTLKVLCIANCQSLKSLPLDIEHFPELETLLVDNCDVLEFSKEHNNQNSNLRLKIVNFISLPQLVTLPHWLQGSKDTLQYLLISSCNNLVGLPEWLSAMTCLKTLCVTSCPNMLSLPDGIHRLTTLERLEIDGYPESLQHLTIDEPEEVKEEVEELE
ncbi:Putative disease resistance protein RGA1 [Glycine soja]|uniref:Putative disease resistance protein RGA1 n=1 Tax=Glycine soja TaxID=3848 RepID=A0A0B2QXD8_GLYSO|nr:Putative disease resistance protein RGA1 [Glycine soja]